MGIYLRAGVKGLGMSPCVPTLHLCPSFPQSFLPLQRFHFSTQQSCAPNSPRFSQPPSASISGQLISFLKKNLVVNRHDTFISFLCGALPQSHNRNLEHTNPLLVGKLRGWIPIGPQCAYAQGMGFSDWSSRAGARGGIGSAHSRGLRGI